jgi:hypothetical protein
VLIVCEGAKTECEYLNEIRISKKLSKERVKIEAGTKIEGCDPRAVVKSAKRLRAEMRRSRLIYDEVWCVFDRDEHAQFDQAVDEARRAGINLAVSIPCFELWFLLHFQDQKAHIERDQVIRVLRTHVPRYEKSLSGCYKSFEHGKTDAMRRAAELRSMHAVNREPEHKNPSTRVDVLVQLLEGLRR